MLGSPVLAQIAPTPQVNSPSAQSDPLISYRAYAEAVNSGNLPEAARHGTLAWQLAETKWGASNPNTPGLAFNAAWSAALIGKSAERIDAARRAVELAPSARGAYTLPEAQFLLAYAEYFATPVAARPSAAPKLAAAALPIEATWSDYLLVNALVTSANIGASRNRGRATVAIAERALVAIDRLSPNDKESRVMALFARAQGRLAAGYDQEEAVADLIQARVSYGPMRYADDKSWGALAAWEMAARSVVITEDRYANTTTGSRLTRRTGRALKMTKDQERAIYSERSLTNVDPSQCEAVTRNRRAGSDIAYPSGEITDLRVAGVVLRHDIDTTGRVTNARLLGAVPEGMFGSSALNAVRTWRYIVPANTPAICLIDRNVGVSFAIG